MSENEMCFKDHFESIKDDPELLLSLVDKYVNVQLIKNTSFRGFLHSIDPITLSVILSVPHEGNYQTTVIPGHAITDLNEEIPSSEILPNMPPSRKCVTELTEPYVTKKKNQIKAWFEKNLLPVTESEGNLNIGNISVLSPYNVTDICAENPVIALQIKKIMASMPPDFGNT